MGKLFMDSPPIPQGFGQRPKKIRPKTRNVFAKGQSSPLKLKVSLRSRLYLLIARTHGTDNRHGLIVLTRTHGVDLNS